MVRPAILGATWHGLSARTCPTGFSAGRPHQSSTPRPNQQQPHPRPQHPGETGPTPQWAPIWHSRDHQREAHNHIHTLTHQHAHRQTTFLSLSLSLCWAFFLSLSFHLTAFGLKERRGNGLRRHGTPVDCSQMVLQTAGGDGALFSSRSHAHTFAQEGWKEGRALISSTPSIGQGKSVCVRVCVSIWV